jgi:hypothetical protein
MSNNNIISPTIGHPTPTPAFVYFALIVTVIAVGAVVFMTPKTFWSCKTNNYSLHWKDVFRFDHPQNTKDGDTHFMCSVSASLRVIILIWAIILFSLWVSYFVTKKKSKEKDDEYDKKASKIEIAAHVFTIPIYIGVIILAFLIFASAR